MLNNLNIQEIKKQGVCFKTIDKEKLNERLEINFSKLHTISYESKKKMLLEKRGEIEDKIRDILTNSEENIKSTVPIINNVSKQLMQDNLLLKMKLESMKQTSKNIINHCIKLRQEAEKYENNELNEVLNAILEKFKGEMQKLKEGD